MPTKPESGYQGTMLVRLPQEPMLGQRVAGLGSTAGLFAPENFLPNDLFVVRDEQDIQSMCRVNSFFAIFLYFFSTGIFAQAALALEPLLKRLK